jgi:hypothetical protein
MNQRIMNRRMMNRRMMSRYTLSIIFASLSAACLAQQAPSRPAPSAADAPGTQLIAWSEMQKPHPTQQPQPVPPPDSRSGQQPDSSQPTQSQQDQNTTPQQQQPEPAPSQVLQSMTGIVMKAAGKYVLQTTDSSAYILDDQDKAKSFDGKRVKVTGTLDRPTGILHVSTMEAIS